MSHPLSARPAPYQPVRRRWPGLLGLGLIGTGIAAVLLTQYGPGPAPQAAVGLPAAPLVAAADPVPEPAPQAIAEAAAPVAPVAPVAPEPVARTRTAPAPVTAAAPAPMPAPPPAVTPAVEPTPAPAPIVESPPAAAPAVQPAPAAETPAPAAPAASAPAGG